MSDQPSPYAPPPGYGPPQPPQYGQPQPPQYAQPPASVPPYAQYGYPYAQQPYAYPNPNAPLPAGKPPVKGWDVAITVILLVLLAMLTALMSFFGFFLVMASDPCGVRECSDELITTGVLLAIGLPWLALIVAVVLSIILLVRRKLAFWVPLAAGPLVIGAWFLGAYVTSIGVPTG
jgi:hypothetical protein